MCENHAECVRLGSSGNTLIEVAILFQPIQTNLLVWLVILPYTTK